MYYEDKLYHYKASLEAAQIQLRTALWMTVKLLIKIIHTLKIGK